MKSELEVNAQLQQFTQEINDSVALIDEIIENPPENILIHTYRLEKDESGEWVPSWEGAYGIWAFYLLSQQIAKEHPEHRFKVYFACDHSKIYEGQSMSTIYANTLRNLNLPIVKEVNDENEFDKSGSLGTVDEVEFLKKNIGSMPVVQIARAGHTNRVKALDAKREINSTVVSSESILYKYMPEIFNEHLESAEVKQELSNYTRDEQILLMITLLDGGRGNILSLAAKLAGAGLRNRIIESLKRIRGDK